MNQKQNMNSIELHSAGAIIRPETPFDSIPTYLVDYEVTTEFAEKWVSNIYMKSIDSKEFKENYISVKNDLSEEIVNKLLSTLDWRVRKLGTIYATIKKYVSFKEIIGNHLLKSEVCCVGSDYAVALVQFNSPESVEFLRSYSEYYLTRQDLDFEQISVMQALYYLDTLNGTTIHETYKEACQSFLDERNTRVERNLKRHPKYKGGFVPQKLSNCDWIINSLRVYKELEQM